MALRRIPDFLSSYPKEDKERLMKQYIQWKKWEITGIMIEHYEKKLDQLIQEDEKDSPLSWFSLGFGRAKRLGERKMLRNLIKNLKE